MLPVRARSLGPSSTTTSTGNGSDTGHSEHAKRTSGEQEGLHTAYLHCAPRPLRRGGGHLLGLLPAADSADTAAASNHHHLQAPIACMTHNPLPPDA